jgi:hypothetical protein
VTGSGSEICGGGVRVNSCGGMKESSDQNDVFPCEQGNVQGMGLVHSRSSSLSKWLLVFIRLYLSFLSSS